MTPLEPVAPGGYAPLADIADINPGMSARPANDTRVSFVAMADVCAESARVIHEDVRRYAEVAKGYTQFHDGDLLVAKITPCYENNKIAQAQLSEPLGAGSTEFHVVRPKPDKADARYLMHYLRQGRIRSEGQRKMTGSAGQRRVPAHFLAGLQIPIPPLPDQHRIAAILDQADVLRAKRRSALAQLDEMTQAIFVEMFGDATEIERRWPTKPLGQILVRGAKVWAAALVRRIEHAL